MSAKNEFAGKNFHRPVLELDVWFLVFQLLLKHKCDLSAKNEDEETPFLIAAKHGQSE